MRILAVESSCDETSVAIVEDGKNVISHVVLSQIDIHKIYGGVVPEIASRNHIVHMTRVFEQALKEANMSAKDIDLVAVTKGPGLIGSLLVGINAATTFAFAHQLPIIGVNHLIGHIYAANIEHEIKFPALTLLISGGHTELLYLKDHMDIKMLGTTLDDAVGEAYDKVARTLGLPYPGGPVIDKLSVEGIPTYQLPRPLIDDESLNFSFSGLKSAVINLVHNEEQRGNEINKANMCASFQNAVIDVLITKTKKAAEKLQVNQIIVAGGVAANKGLRKRIFEEIKDIEIIIPSMKYCTDNAAMIGAAAYQQYLIEGAKKSYLIGGESTIPFDLYDI
ncbi:MAG: tRNA (adenosine(37)-N6)-threonylcarbamoyltransferase complex transferase subunit TsaD [Acholeplasmataceae bacterium]